jgi:hypothetical protein
MKHGKPSSCVTAGVALLKALSYEHRPKFLQPFADNGDVSIWVKDSGVERKPVINQSINPGMLFLLIVFFKFKLTLTAHP